MRQAAATSLLLLLTLATATAAQDADAGIDDDAGVPGPGMTDDDAGMTDPSADAGPRAACSCEIVEDRGEDGTVHTCTGTFEEALCETFSCERSNVLQRTCPTTGIDLCCDMGSRGLYTNLYDDCTYPSCEAGFRAQCAEFGGTVFSGTCGGQTDDGSTPRAGDDDDDGGSGFCSVSTPGTGSAPGSPGSASALLACLLALTLLRRRRL